MIFNLDEIDVSKFETIKSREKWYGNQDHSRWIFYDRKNKLYYKIWNETYIRRNTIIDAINSGFYNKDILPAFKGIIQWEGVCRGYVMEECEKYGKMDKSFFSNIKKITKNTNMFAYDLCPNHIFKYKDKLTLIDLEGVYNLNQYKQKLNEHISLGIPGRFVEYEPYEEYIKEFMYKPLSEKQFLEMPLQKGQGGKEVILVDYQLKTVKDVIEYYSNKNYLKNVESQLVPSNWQYFNCMMAEFRHNVGDHHQLGWENMTKEYYDGYKRRGFVSAMTKALLDPDYNHAYFMKKLKYLSSSLVDCVKWQQYSSIIEDIYNYRTRKPNKIRLDY